MNRNGIREPPVVTGTRTPRAHSLDSPSEARERTGPWWAHVLVFVFMVVATFLLYDELSAVERGEETLIGRAGLAYKVLGKWGILAFASAIGLVNLWIGLAKLWKEP